MSPGRPAVTLVPLDPATHHALAAGDLALARTLSGLDLPEVFVDPSWIGTWRYRSAQVRTDPTSAAWVTGAVVDAATGAVVGKAGFHGPPDAQGVVEVGYAVVPELRRRGFARAALEVLIERAARELGVRVVRASVAPDNHASLRLVAGCGFVRVGEQWDDEDGLEVVLEVPADHSGAGR